MNFWDFLFGVIVVAAVSNAVVNFMRHRQNMAQIKARQLDGKKIAEATKEHLARGGYRGRGEGEKPPAPTTGSGVQ